MDREAISACMRDLLSVADCTRRQTQEARMLGLDD